MIVHTLKGNFYSYLRSANEIVAGEVQDDLLPIQFCAWHPITEFPELQTFTLSITTKCNFRCVYCCYSGNYRNVRSHGETSMSLRDFDRILDFIEVNARVKPIVISFYGGESLLEYSFIFGCINKARGRWGSDVRFEVSTNGYLLSESYVDWFCKKEVTLFISLDGGPKIQDRQRKTATGKPSFARIKSILEYISKRYPDYLQQHVLLLMTVLRLDELPVIAEEWQNDLLLRGIPPARISSVAPNYGQGVEALSYEKELPAFLNMLDVFERHPEYVVLRVFFERWLAEWIQRPVFEINEPQEVPTCMPHNRKLYIDTNYELSVCEKVPDVFRFGSLEKGIDWEAVNEMACKTYKTITGRCAQCPVARLCDVCPAILDLSEDEMDLYCHNKLVMQQVKFRIFCEMAERGLI